MQNSILHIGRKWNLFLATGFIFVSLSTTLNAQQHIIANKDNTRPETARQYNAFNLSSFMVIQQNGYNEITWPAASTGVSGKVFVEYSFDGVNYLSAEQVVPTNGIYKYQHYIKDTRPLLYRIRTEDMNGSANYSGVFFPKGTEVSPVQIQNNVVTGNVLNANAQFPVERVTVVYGNGTPQFAKEVNGLKDFISIALPSLNMGVYFITFFGNGWKSTSRFLVS